jgi:L-threonate 2-dehydrogenase
MTRTVGIVGLGAMGSAFATNLVAAGFDVLGHDIDPSRADRLRDHGVRATSLDEVGRAAEVIVTSLPSVSALEEVVAGLETAGGEGDTRRRVLAETGTLPVSAKESAARRLGERGFTVLDTPISGTGAQARTRDLAVYASGDRAVVESCRDVFAGFARSCHYVGEFGTGMTVKLVANLLVAVHNVAAAEALLLGRRAGVDPRMLLDVLTDGAGTSRMLEVRGPLMLAGEYEPATATVGMFEKDLALISSLAAAHESPTPLLAASEPLYSTAAAQGRRAQDAASVMAVLETWATRSAAGPGET